MALLTISQHIGCARQSGLLTSRLVGACPRCGVASLTTEHPWQGPASAGTRKINADPCPPPPHSAAAPVPPPRRFNSSARCKAILAPDMPIGWPMAMAPPLTFTFDGSRPKVRVDAIPTAAKASLISMRSRAVGSRRSCAQAAAMALAGCCCSVESGPATTPCAPISASQSRPSSIALALLITTTAAAPSLIDEALPAVMVPVLENAGRSAERDAAVMSARTPSSWANTTDHRCAGRWTP